MPRLFAVPNSARLKVNEFRKSRITPAELALPIEWSSYSVIGQLGASRHVAILVRGPNNLAVAKVQVSQKNRPATLWREIAATYFYREMGIFVPEILGVSVETIDSASLLKAYREGLTAAEADSGLGEMIGFENKKGNALFDSLFEKAKQLQLIFQESFKPWYESNYPMLLKKYPELWKAVLEDPINNIKTHEQIANSPGDVNPKNMLFDSELQDWISFDP